MRVFNEPKVVRRSARFGGSMPPDQMIQKYHRNDPNWYVPFAYDKNYIRADKWNKWAAVGIGRAVLIVVALDSAWLMGWLSK